VTGDAVARNAACESCHQDVAEEWRASLHRSSYTDGDYQRSFAIEPLAFCTSCHAPEATAAAPEPARAALGVGCVTCHAPGHAGRPRACAGCHEFAFPDGVGKMQLTVTEHRVSARTTTPCEGCHMPRLGQRDRQPNSRMRRDHRFAASRDPSMLARAATIQATRTATGVTVHLEPRDVGHALPTGDIFRRLRIVIESEQDTRTRAQVFLSRKSKLGGGYDDRPFVDGRPRDVAIPIAASGRSLRWAVFYERVAHPTTLDESSAEVLASIELASGVLPSIQ
jgi:Cytochrome c554 and c-prime